MDDDKKVVRSLEEELLFFDTNVDTTTEKRSILTDTAMALAARVDPSNIDIGSSESVSAASTALNVALKVLDATEASAARRINQKIKLADQARADNMTGKIIEVYRQMASGSPPPDMPVVDIDKSLEDITTKFFAEGGVILDTELRSDPNDLS